MQREAAAYIKSPETTRGRRCGAGGAGQRRCSLRHPAVQICRHTHAHIHTHTYMHIYTHIQMLPAIQLD